MINNAIEHAFKGREKGNISISLDKVKEEIEIEVNDDGIGIKEEIINGEESSESLGFTLVDTLTNQLNGSNNYISNGKDGTQFKLQFKPEKKQGSANIFF